MQEKQYRDVKTREYNLRYKSENKERIKEQRKDYRARNEGKIALQVLEKKLKYRYRMTYSMYQLMLGLQEGKCAICGAIQDFVNGGRRLHVDHDHETGKVRGLLCQKCNQALGSFKDSIETLQAAITYLKNHGKRK